MVPINPKMAIRSDVDDKDFHPNIRNTIELKMIIRDKEAYIIDLTDNYKNC